MSVAMIAVTGGCLVLSWLPADTVSSSLALACGERTTTTRAGLLLAEVGPHFISSYSCFRVASEIGSAGKPLWGRGLSNSCPVVMFMALGGTARARVASIENVVQGPPTPRGLAISGTRLSHFQQA